MNAIENDWKNRIFIGLLTFRDNKVIIMFATKSTEHGNFPIKR